MHYEGGTFEPEGLDRFPLFSQSGGRWQEDAACQGMGLVMFFPESKSNEAAQPAKAVCGGCPVIEKCLQFALETDQHNGIWGGLSEKELKREQV